MGLTNSSVVLPNDRQRHSPDAAAASSQSNAVQLSKDAKTTTDGNEPNDGFTLMHPAFQNVQQKRKFYNNLDRNGSTNHTEQQQHAFFSIQSDLNKKLHHDPNAKFMDYANKLNKDQDSGDSTGESSDSEEIDLTSNGCIDFSNNNNSEKSEIMKKC